MYRRSASKSCRNSSSFLQVGGTAARIPPAPPPERFGNVVFERGVSPMTAWREHLGLTQVEVASRLGISQAAYAQMERSKQPRRATLEKVAAALGLETDQLRW